MKHFKTLSLLLTGVLALGMTACTSDDDSLVKNEKWSGETYMRVTISVPNNAGTTRADVDDSEIYDAGTEAEAEVKSVMLYFVSTETGNLARYINVTGFEKSKEPVATPTTEEEGYTTYTETTTSASTKIQLEPGVYHVYAVANGKLAGDPTEDIELGTSESKIMDAKLSAFKRPGQSIPEGGIPMSSRLTNAADPETAAYTTVTVDKNQEYTPEAPLTFSLTVERLFAKYTIEENHKSALGVSGSENIANVFDVSFTDSNSVTSTVAQVKILGVKPINMMNRTFGFREVGRLSGGTVKDRSYGKMTIDTSNEWQSFYLLDPKILDKNGALAEGSPLETEANQAARKNNQLLRILKPITWGNDTLPALVDGTGLEMPNDGSMTVTYAFDNSMARPYQYMGYCTGFMFTAQIRPVENDQVNKIRSEVNGQVATYNTGDSLVYFNGHLYVSIAAVRAWNNTYANEDKYPVEGKNGLKDKYGLIVYPTNRGYYYYYPRHWDNNDPLVMGVSEFITCRNNLYKMKIADIMSLPPASKTDDTPVEEFDLYMKVSLNVKPWIVRNNTGIVLK